MTATKHDLNCRLCWLLAAGETVTKIGREIPALCPLCVSHHFPGGCAQNIDKAICPGCRKNTRDLVAEPKEGRGKQRYGEYCASCYEDRGFKRLTLDAWTWYEPKPVADDVDDAELFESLNPRDRNAERVRS